MQGIMIMEEHVVVDMIMEVILDVVDMIQEEVDVVEGEDVEVGELIDFSSYFIKNSFLKSETALYSSIWLNNLISKFVFSI